MKIVNLNQIPECLLTLASWHQREWSYLNPGQTLQVRIEKMQAFLNQDFIPTTYVALDSEVLGSAAVIDCDLESRPELSPWLASVYVAPEYRRHGVATHLIQHVMQQVKEQGYKKLYLYTPDQEKFYQKLGWQVMDKVLYHDTEIVLMQVDLQLIDF